ncbi:AraC family transcriptional regulator [Shewanella eurypsychrophilus]|uniref:AraC family transcriptional regulator n=1 Tax=Shewanella eurypsychrophilus TaxID=2593656 RepID=A0ABX6VKQ0_9GAMM|nr:MULTISPECIES: AraC family transcriptional regulator [Shewanella]QPG60492.2 AraC family transcriptional regulator [Shewanella eurypsychrophilus]
MKQAQSYKPNMMVGDQSYPAYQLRNVLNYLRQHYGQEVVELLCSQIGVGVKEIEHQQVIYVWQADFAMEFLQTYTQDAEIGAKVGHQYSVTDLDFLLSFFSRCETIGDCLQFVLSHPELVGSFTDTLVSNEAGKLHVRWLNTGRINAKRYSCQFQHSVCGLLTIGKELAGLPILADQIFLSDAERNTDFLASITGAEVHFGAEFNEWTINHKFLSLPVTYAFETKTTRTHANQQTSYIQTLLEALRHSFPECPNMDEMAIKHNISARTLRRKISQAGTSYQKLVDQVRCQAAIGLILSGEKSIDEIAEVMGYGEVSHFRQSFKHWLGHPPGHFLRLNEKLA